MSTILAFSIFQGIEKPRDSAGITELRADLSYPWIHHCDADLPFELFQHTFTGMRALLFASGSSPAATEARHTSHRALGASDPPRTECLLLSLLPFPNTLYFILIYLCNYLCIYWGFYTFTYLYLNFIYLYILYNIFIYFSIYIF